MDYQIIDESYFYTLHVLPKVIMFEIVECTFEKCTDCKKYVLAPYSCVCGVIRCKFHYFLNTSYEQCYTCYDKKRKINRYTNIYKLPNKEVFFKCIENNCDDYACYGYNDIVCYCHEHAKNKYKTMLYIMCCTYLCTFMTNYDDEKNNPICKIHMKPDKTYKKMIIN